MNDSYPEATTVPRTLGPVHKIPIGEGRTFLVDGLEVAVVRTRTGEVFAFQSRCPHRGGPLADGLVGDGKLVCPLHGYTFVLATGESLGRVCTSINTYPIEVTDEGDLLLQLQQPAPCAG